MDVFQNGTDYSKLAELNELEGEYFSHLFALFLLGFRSAPPDILTAVSGRRRRNRVFAGRNITFVYHRNDRSTITQEISVNGNPLRVSTLEKTLVDLLTDMDYSPSIEELAHLFSSLQFDRQSLINIAHKTSDTVLKRASFLLAWSGRMHHNELDFSAFKRTPVKLDPRICRDEQTSWDNRFFIKYPCNLLALQITVSGAETTPDLKNWLELRSNPTFIGLMQTEGKFPILGEECRWSDRLKESTFRQMYDEASSDGIERLLMSRFDHGRSNRESRHLPVLFIEWLDKHPEILLEQELQIRYWVRTNLNTDNIDRLEAALHYGCLLDMDEEILAGFAKFNNELYNSGRFMIIETICTKYLHGGFDRYYELYVVAARTRARLGQYDNAIEILDQGKAIFEKKDDAFLELGELFYTSGSIFRLMNHLNESLTELFVAREFFCSAKNTIKIASVECALGNLYFAKGSIHAARSYYFSALAKMKQQNIKSAQATILANIGILDYDSNRNQSAAAYLQKAISMHRMSGGNWYITNTAISLAKVWLKMGWITKAQRLLMQCYREKDEQGHEGGKLESAALIAWTNDLLGQTAAAEAWRHILHDYDRSSQEPRANFVIDTTLGMKAFFESDFVRSMEIYESMLRECIERDSPALMQAEALFGKALNSIFLNHDGAMRILLQAMEKSTMNPLRSHYCQIRYTIGSFFPGSVAGLDLESELADFIDGRNFDPFWTFYAERLLGIGASKAKAFLVQHSRKTPPSMLKSLMNRNKNLKNILAKIGSEYQEAEEYFTFLTPYQSRSITCDEYFNWTQLKRTDCFSFDSPKGLLAFKTNRTGVKPGSILHTILCQLLAAYPHPINIGTMFRAAWGTDFDPEFDKGALKSALHRLQSILLSACPSVKIRRAQSNSYIGAIMISLPCDYEIIL